VSTLAAESVRDLQADSSQPTATVGCEATGPAPQQVFVDQSGIRRRVLAAATLLIQVGLILVASVVILTLATSFLNGPGLVDLGAGAPAQQTPVSDGASSAAQSKVSAEEGGGINVARVLAIGLFVLGTLLILLDVFLHRRQRRVAAGTTARAESSEQALPPEPMTQTREYTSPKLLDFAAGLSESVLPRAEVMFDRLERDGIVSAGQLAEALDCRPAALGGLLLTPLRRRSRALELPLPYRPGRSPSGHRVLFDEGGLAARMSVALREARERREDSPVEREAAEPIAVASEALTPA
jgi:hypothetical protein